MVSDTLRSSWKVALALVLTIMLSAALILVALGFSIKAADMGDAQLELALASSQIAPYKAASNIALLCAFVLDTSFVAILLWQGYLVRSRNTRKLALFLPLGTAACFIVSGIFSIIPAAASNLWPLGDLVRILSLAIERSARLL